MRCELLRAVVYFVVGAAVGVVSTYWVMLRRYNETLQVAEECCTLTGECIVQLQECVRQVNEQVKMWLWWQAPDSVKLELLFGDSSVDNQRMLGGRGS